VDNTVRKVRGSGYRRGYGADRAQTFADPALVRVERATGIEPA
jgi:hypothetical protein